MKKLIKQSLLFLIMAGIAAGTSVRAEENQDNSVEKGFGIGALVGGLLGGPPGLVIGSVIGSSVGNHHSQDMNVAHYQQQLLLKEQQLLALNDEIQQLKLARQLKTVNLQQQKLTESKLNEFRFSIFYHTGKSEIDPMFQPVVKQLISLAKKDQSINIYLDAYADPRGEAGFNQGLSEKRASRLKQDLIKSGIAANRISIRAHGETKFSEQTKDLDRFAMQRRVDIQLSHSDEV